MLSIEKLDPSSKAQARRFVHLPFRLYRNNPHWVPPIVMDQELQLNRAKYPFFEHSEADFFIATRDHQDVGRIAVMENRPFNRYHGTRQAHFYFFESENDQEIVNALFDCVFEWAHGRHLDTVLGPKGMGVLDGMGILYEGFEEHQMMLMMPYNPPHYPHMMEALGFGRKVDYVSCYARADSFRLPEQVHRIAERVERRGTLRVQHCRNKAELKAWALRAAKAYDKAFVRNWEYAPQTDRELALIVDNLIAVADPKLIKLIVHGEDVVGFLLAFPDATPALRRCQGRLLPFGLLDLLQEMRRTHWLAINAAGILPEFQGIGGNALLYSEMEKTVHEYNFEFAALYQVAETAQMIQDLEKLGLVPRKKHRIYMRAI